MAKIFKVKNSNNNTAKIGKDVNNKGRITSEDDIVDDPEGNDCNCAANVVCQVLQRPVDWKTLEPPYWPGTSFNYGCAPVYDFVPGCSGYECLSPICSRTVADYVCVNGKLTFSHYSHISCGTFNYEQGYCDRRYTSYPRPPISFMEEIP